MLVANSGRGELRPREGGVLIKPKTLVSRQARCSLPEAQGWWGMGRGECGLNVPLFSTQRQLAPHPLTPSLDPAAALKVFTFGGHDM